MKKVGIALLLVLVLAGVALVGVQRHGFGLLGFSYTWNEELAQLDKLARAFLQDLQFKDFDKAAKYHSFVDQAKANIPQLIERLFQVKPEMLNIRDFEIVRVDLDDDGKRARTFFRSNLELLNTAEGDKPNKEKQIEGILYWHKLPVGAGKAPSAEGTATTTDAPTTTEAVAAEAEQWFMKLESSLR